MSVPPTISLPAFTPGQPAARVDACLRVALAACDHARQCAVLWFAEVQRRELYRELGHASLQLYAAQALGFSDNRTRQFKRLADDLDRLPALRDAVAAGELGWTKAQQVARVASPATQAAWIARAKATGRRELEQQVRTACAKRRAPRVAAGQLELGSAAGAVTNGAVTSGAVASGAVTSGAGTSGAVTGSTPGAAGGSPPGAITGAATADTGIATPTTEAAPCAAADPFAARAPAHAAGSRHTISLQLDAWQLARFEALLAQVRRRRLVPPGADRAEVVLAALATLAGSDDVAAGTAGGNGVVEGSNGDVQGSDDVAAGTAGGNGELQAGNGNAQAGNLAGNRNKPRPRHRHRPAHGAPPVQVVVQQCPDCRAAVVATSRGESALPPARVAALDCDARVRRAGQPNRATVPPRLRAAVLARDRHRCATPGCGATQFLEVHHVVPRSAGGANTVANLTTLCSRCHGFTHERHLRAPAHAAAAPAAPVGTAAAGTSRASTGQGAMRD